MKTMFGALIGALALGAVLVSYDLGARHTFSPDPAALSMGYQPGNPYLVPVSQTGYVSPYAPNALPYAAQYPYGAAPAAGYPAAQYVNERVVAPQPVVRRATTQRVVAAESVSKPKRTWQKSALLIGGSAAGGAGVGALVGGKKGAGIGALIGGGTAAIYDQVKRH